MITVTESSINILKETEGFSPVPYSDGYGYSIGYGHYIGVAPEFVYKNVVYSRNNLLPEFIAREILIKDLQARANEINSVITIPLSENQANALLKWSFSQYAEPLQRVKDSNLLPLIQSMETEEKIRNWWTTHYITENGILSNPLIKRRNDEVNLFFSDPFPYEKKNTCI